MENIEQILQELNVELTDDQKKILNKKVGENYKTIKDYNDQKEKLDLAKEQLNTTKQTFDDFKKNYEGVDVEELRGKIKTLTETVDNQKSDYEKKIASMNLEKLLSEKASEVGCVDFDLAKGQLDMEALLSSKDQTADISTAFENLKKTKPILFKQEDPKPKGMTNIIQSTSKNGNEGSITLKDAIREHYNK